MIFVGRVAEWSTDESVATDAEQGRSPPTLSLYRVKFYAAIHHVRVAVTVKCDTRNPIIEN